MKAYVCVSITMKPVKISLKSAILMSHPLLIRTNSSTS